METRSIYLTVRVDVAYPDSCDCSDLDLASEFRLDGISLPEDYECKVIDFEICGINEQ